MAYRNQCPMYNTMVLGTGSQWAYLRLWDPDPQPHKIWTLRPLSDCPKWTHFCKNQYEEWMKRNCKKTCGLCGKYNGWQVLWNENYITFLKTLWIVSCLCGRNGLHAPKPAAMTASGPGTVQSWHRPAMVARRAQGIWRIQGAASVLFVVVLSVLRIRLLVMMTTSIL